ncbi:MAG TPA: DUF2062 domain-containing protein [Burkholderiales bacterium]|jgi:uncharacterized protein (DUF2062 family)|nr:DUF2062 domain-containing protein [Burkholderiales bacterium]
MPRKLFRKYLPSHESMRQHRWLRFFGTAVHHHNLWHLNRRSVAGGVAVGLFAGLIPGPFQILSAALLAIVLRVNLPVAAVVTFYTNPLTIVPLYFVAYRLGSLVLGHDGSALPQDQIDLFDLPLRDWIPALVSWMGAMGKPFLFGLFLLATLLAVTGYVAVMAAWRLHVWWSWRRRHRARPGTLRR